MACFAAKKAPFKFVSMHILNLLDHADARVIHEDIQLACRRSGAVDEPLHVARDAHIAGRLLDPQFGEDRTVFGEGAEVPHEDRGALPRQQQSRGPSDAAGAARDNRYALRKVVRWLHA